MLRITLQNGSRPATLKLEGKLSGPWVDELARVWEKFTANDPGKVITLDLSEVSFIDSAGKKLLSSLVEKGAELRDARFLMTKYIVEQVIEGHRATRTGG